MPNQNDPTQNPTPVNPVPPVISPQADLPPLPPAFQNLNNPTPPVAASEKENTSPPSDNGSAAPPDISSVTSKPKKKFGGGRIIATILGLFLLVGGVGAGIVLTQQPQLLQQKASTICPVTAPDLCKCYNCDGSVRGSGCLPASESCDAYCGGSSTPTNCNSQTCTPNTSTKSCTESNGCAGTETCNSSGTGYGSCVQNDSSCGKSSGGASCSGGIADGKIGCLDSATGVVCNNGAFSQTKQYCPQGTKCVNGSSPGSFCSACSPATSCCFANSTVPSSPVCTVSHKYLCSNGSCIENDTNGTFTSNTCGGTCSGTPNPNVADCGSAAVGGACTTGSDCHCQGGDACTSLLCQPDQHQSCLSQSRAWCVNMTGKGMTCCAAGYVCAVGVNGCVSGPSAPTSSPPNNPTAPSCVAVTAYTPTWTALTSAQLSALTTGAQINFCVSGSNGTFDQADFKINSTVEAATTTKRPSSSDFCQLYTIQASDTTISVSAKIHDTTKGWVGESF